MATLGESPRVAVLAFDNLSRDPSDAFIVRSIPEMVLNRLSSVRGLTVIARDSALLSAAAEAPANEAGAPGAGRSSAGLRQAMISSAIEGAS